MSFMLRAALLTAALIVLPASSAQAQRLCLGADAHDGTAQARTTAVRCLVEGAREEAGRPPLRRAGALTRSARIKASRIESCGEFTHTPCDTPFEAPMRTVGYARGCFDVAENLAWVSPDATPRDVLQAWLDSPAHRATLLSKDYRETGVARLAASMPGDGDVELWVQHFGSHC